ncbi:unnamed protein product [Lactuca saligna]|uniref:Uncharacterized protein n=1 Tax=Lactuca saligna TaxID=75948 RepID=A0AA35ZG91_LACSI|nr:unnamed protein product [Lactuca saligna]
MEKKASEKKKEKVTSLITVVEQWKQKMCYLMKRNKLKTQYFQCKGTTNVYIHHKVIDCWSILLNGDETRKQMGSPLRFYFQIGIITEEMTNEEIPMDDRCKMFDQKATKAMKFHPYAQVFDKLEFVALMANFMMEGGFKKAFDLLTKEILVFKIKWWLKNNFEENVVALMRHMECFQGHAQSSWDCDIEKDQKQQKEKFTKLRVKYLTKLLLNDINLNRKEIVDQGIQFDKKTEEEKNTLLKNAMQKYKERFKLMEHA